MVKKRCIILLVVFSLFLSLVAAEETDNIILNLKNIQTNQNISSAVVILKIEGSTISQFMGEDSIIKITIPNGSYDAEFLVDEGYTEGKDFYGKETLDVKENLTKNVYLYPVGSIRGIVKDSLDNIVGNAKLNFECSGAGIAAFPENANKFGSFSVDYMPAGSCKIYASYKGAIGFTEVTVEKGSLKDIEIKLDKSIVPAEKSYMWFIIILLIVIIFAVIIIFGEKIKSLVKTEKKLEKAGKKEEKEIKELKAELKLDKRAMDVMETLKEKEKEIVEFIVKEKGKTTQSRIYNETGIPKASLFRYIQSLEIKKVIEVKKIGKVKRIKFTKWFLGEEENVPQSSA